MQIGGRDTQPYAKKMSLALADIKMRMDACMEILTPYYADPHEADLTPDQEYMLDEHMNTIDWAVNEMRRNIKQIKRQTPIAVNSHIYKLTVKVIQAYKQLYAAMIEDHASVYQRHLGMEDAVPAFYSVVRNIHIPNSV